MYPLLEAKKLKRITFSHVVEILVVGGIPAITAICSAVLISYFKEKGKNQAMQEDLKKITTIVENVKNEFVRENELLKSRLSLYAQNYNSIAILERDAIIEVNKKFSEWHHGLMTFSLVYYNLENWEILKTQDAKFIEKQLAFEVAENHLSLFMHDQEIRRCLSPLRTLTFHFQLELAKHILKFTGLCRQYNDLSTGLKDTDKITALHKEYLGKQQLVIDSCASITEQLNNKIFSHYVTFIKVLNHRIYQLIEQDQNA